MRNLTLLSLCLALFLIRASRANEELVVFGDSLSDNGNLFALTGGAHPPKPYGDTYDKSGRTFPGRFTDGQNWADYFPSVADHFLPITAYWNDKGTNFAVGGSISADLLKSDPLGFPPQIFTYLNTVGNQASAEDLYVIWIGTNDFAAGISPETTVANIREGIVTLIHAGAKHFIVIDIPNISLTPLVKALPSPEVAGAKQFVAVVDLLLAVEIPRLAWTERVDADLLEINTIFVPVVLEPAFFGFSYSVGAAYNPNAPLSPSNPVSDPNDYVFWDGFHPTTNVHFIAAEFIYKALFLRRHFHGFLSVR
jgi:outer membrane lipase/esterase